jgi:hypothetical protein
MAPTKFEGLSVKTAAEKNLFASDSPFSKSFCHAGSRFPKEQVNDQPDPKGD